GQVQHAPGAGRDEPDDAAFPEPVDAQGGKVDHEVVGRPGPREEPVDQRKPRVRLVHVRLFQAHAGGPPCPTQFALVPDKDRQRTAGMASLPVLLNFREPPWRGPRPRPRRLPPACCLPRTLPPPTPRGGTLSARSAGC